MQSKLPPIQYVGGQPHWDIDGRLLPVVSGGANVEPPLPPPPPPDPTQSGFQQGAGEAVPPGEGGPPPPPAATPDAGQGGQPLTPAQVDLSALDPAQLLQVPAVQALVTKTRDDEKSKLYGQIDDTKTQLNQLTEWQRKKQEEETAAEKTAADQAERERLEKLTLTQRIEEMERQRTEDANVWRNELEIRDAQLAKERELSAVSEYRSSQLAANVDQIHPSLTEFVVGGSPEEIDNAIARAVQSSQTILAEVQQSLQGMQQLPPGRGPSLTGAPPVGPSENQQATRTFTAEEIQRMSGPEYAQYRTALMASATKQGPYGAPGS